jgi:hypothetical protein
MTTAELVAESAAVLKQARNMDRNPDGTFVSDDRIVSAAVATLAASVDVLWRVAVDRLGGPSGPLGQVLRDQRAVCRLVAESAGFTDGGRVDRRAGGSDVESDEVRHPGG